MDSSSIQEWAEKNFGNAALGDMRLTKRAVQVAARIAAKTSASLPKQCAGAKSELAGAYRLFDNAAIRPKQMISAHQEHTLEQCRRLPVVLCVQDGTELDYSGRQVEGLGEIGNGKGQGLMQQSVLAVSEQGVVIGVLHLNIHKRKKKPVKETARQRQARETQAQVWAQSAQEVDKMNFGDARRVHVCDREADCFDFLDTCRQLKHDYVVRAKHDRKAQEEIRLWEHVQKQSVSHEYELQVPARKKGKRPKGHRKARVSVKYAKVKFAPPVNDPRYAKKDPIELWAVQVVELEAPEGHEVVEWMLLTTLRVESVQEALRVIGYYKHRWKIEEWHRCLKQGCAVEQAQMKEAQTLANQAAMKAVVAVRLVRMRDAAREESKAGEEAKHYVEPMQLKALALLSGRKEEHIKLGEYWEAVARLGGWLGRKNDGPPGWLTIWRGWMEIELIAKGVALATMQKDV